MSSIAKIIEITSVPHGDAPLWVRGAWVGCVLPCASLECGHVPQYVESVLPRKRKGQLTAAEYMALPTGTMRPMQ